MATICTAHPGLLAALAAGRSQPSLNLSHAVAIVLAQLFELQAQRLGGSDLFEPGEHRTSADAVPLWSRWALCCPALLQTLQTLKKNRSMAWLPFCALVLPECILPK